MDETNMGFMSHNGGLELKKIDEKNYSFLSVVKEIHLNSAKITHGGYLATIADTGMGTAAHMISNKRCVTISLEIKFISAGFLDQKLTGKIKILRYKHIKKRDNLTESSRLVLTFIFVEVTCIINSNG